MRRIRSLACAAGLWGALTVGPLLGAAPASADAAAAARLAPVIARVLSYERTLAARARGTIDLVILYAENNANSVAEAKALMGAFKQMSNVTVQGLPLRARLVAYSEQQLGAALSEAGDVVLVCEGLEAGLPDIARQARAAGVLTIGVRREHAKDATSLAVILEAGRLHILANLSHASAEGVQLSAQLLRRSEIL